MDALDAILTRRSVRKFKKDPVDDKQIKTLLTAAMSAPSAGDQRCWRFVVVTDRETLDGLREYHPYADPVLQAPLAIVVCGDTDMELHADFWEQDCAAATENILIAANALGLGAVWLGCHPRADRVKGIQRHLGIPKRVIPLSLIAIGYSNEVKVREDRYDGKKIHRDRW